MGTALTPEALQALETLANNVADRVATRRTEQRDREIARRELPRPTAPTFDGSPGASWTGFLSRFSTFRNVAGLDAAQSKNFLHLALVSEAGVVAIDYPPSDHEQKTYAQYENLLTSVFSPASEKALQKLRFLERRQSPQETIQQYLIAKKSLFSIAFGQTQNRDLLGTLYSECAKGVLHVEVARAIMAKIDTFQNFTELLQTASGAVATERALCLSGKSSVTAGLQAVSGAGDPARAGGLLVTGATTAGTVDAVGGAASGAVVDMDIGNVQFMEALLHDPDIYSALPDEVVAAVVGSPGFQCWSCGASDHGWRSPKCPKPRQVWRGGRGGPGNWSSGRGAPVGRGTGYNNYQPRGATASRGSSERGMWRSGPPVAGGRGYSGAGQGYGTGAAGRTAGGGSRVNQIEGATGPGTEAATADCVAETPPDFQQPEDM